MPWSAILMIFFEDKCTLAFPFQYIQPFRLEKPVYSRNSNSRSCVVVARGVSIAKKKKFTSSKLSVFQLGL